MRVNHVTFPAVTLIRMLTLQSTNYTYQKQICIQSWSCLADRFTFVIIPRLYSGIGTTPKCSGRLGVIVLSSSIQLMSQGGKFQTLDEAPFYRQHKSKRMRARAAGMELVGNPMTHGSLLAPSLIDTHIRARSHAHTQKKIL